MNQTLSAHDRFDHSEKTLAVDWALHLDFFLFFKVMKRLDSACASTENNNPGLLSYNSLTLEDFAYFVFTRMPGESYIR